MSSTVLLGTPTKQHTTGGIWDYVSPSRLNCWLKCPLAFKLRYIDGIRTPTTPSLFIGKQVHFGLEVFGRHQMLGIMLSPEEVARKMIDGWDAAVEEEGMKFDTEADEMALRKQAVDLVAAYLLQASQRIPQAVEITMETPVVDPFTGEDMGISLLGIVDLIVDSGSGAMIVDFKTAARRSAALEVSHEIQLSCYAYLFRQITGQKEAGLEIRSLIKTKVPKIECHQFPARTDTHFGRLFAVVREYLDALDSGRFNYRPGWGCAMCDFRGTHCRKWAG